MIAYQGAMYMEQVSLSDQLKLGTFLIFQKYFFQQNQVLKPVPLVIYSEPKKYFLKI